MDTLELTKKLIAIPTYVSEDFNEEQLVNFLEEYIKENLPWMKTFKEEVSKGRNNLIAYNSKTPKIVFSSHMDTVIPSGDIKNRLGPKVVDGMLVGLGSVDMKGGLAASVVAAQKDQGKTEIALIFTCDEEYYFAGVKRFIEDFKLGRLPFKKGFKPKVVIFPEPTNLEIGYACRGCVELEITLQGATAHAGRPALGVNAIEKSVELVQKLKVALYEDSNSTTVNLASITGGLSIDGKIESRANAVADKATFVLDIRTGNCEQDSKKIEKIVKAIAYEIGIKVLSVKTRLNLLPYKTSKKTLPGKYNEDISSTGYGEFAMLGSELGWDCVNLGPGPSQMAHKSEEYVNIQDLEKTTQKFRGIFNLLKEKS